MLYVHLKLASTDITAWTVHFDNFDRPESDPLGYRYSRYANPDEEDTFYRDRLSCTVTGIDAKVFCLPVLEYRGIDNLIFDCYLLLNQVKTENVGAEKYKRFGLITITRKADEDFPFIDWPITRFTFI